ncbi:protein ENHANCED PSEUDOMONAS SUSCEPTIBILITY 1-like [Salvia miltiorrhiza]|uniref:protein ENHANCED PSEUDOMONAS SUSCEPTIBILITY 1-like n=1 Tax=Salvia miltiorrhiza TaxID=226208 RepID=UPI0025AC378C|nr:protein ENHANCED PSEUDOMONAS SUSCEPTIBILITY 1-like [Salvia miltiorrhiza]
MKMARIDVISSCLVGTTSTDATPISRLELTPWDLQLLQFNPMQRGLFFPKPESDQKSYILHLKNSFSRALDFFPPLAGRLAAVPAADNSFFYFVDCNNAGAEFTHADAPAVSVSHILEPKYIPEIVSDLFPLEGYCNCDGLSKPLLGVQVTQLADGVFVGCTANHAVIDGVSLWHFINSWSELSRGSATISKHPVFDRWFPSSMPDDNRLFPLPALEKIRYPPPPLMARVFRFSKESLAELKSKANSEAGTDKISTLQALSAHLWRSTTRCRGEEDDLSSQEVSIMMAIGARARIPLADGYFGNAFNSSFTKMSTSELLERGLGHAALKINAHVAAQSGEAVIKTVEDWVKNPVVFQRFPPRKRSSVVMIASSHRHNVYANDFGWGKPISALSGKIEQFDGNMKLFPAAVAGGIDVEVCLVPETMQAMEDDAEFMEAMLI